jgi:hypothetical protein
MRQRRRGGENGVASLIDHDAVGGERRLTRIDARREWKYEERGSVSA